jgi:spore coat protein CotF
MHEKDMVLDILNGVKSSIGNYAKIITETNDQQLRQTVQQMRDGDEKFQYDLFKIAEQKGYYIMGPQATQEQCSSMRQSLSAASSMF